MSKCDYVECLSWILDISIAFEILDLCFIFPIKLYLKKFDFDCTYDFSFLLYTPGSSYLHQNQRKKNKLVHVVLMTRLQKRDITRIRRHNKNC